MRNTDQQREYRDLIGGDTVIGKFLADRPKQVLKFGFEIVNGNQGDRRNSR